MNKFLLILMLPYAVMANESITNFVMESKDSEISLGYTKQLIIGNEKRVYDASGKVVAYAEAEAQKQSALSLQRISDATTAGITNALSSLWGVTNQVPTHAEHIVLSLPRTTTPVNLVGEVIEEGTDGTTDWQIVKYSQYLALPPKRHITYHYLAITSKVSVVWDAPWSKTSLTHRCTFTRPSIAKNYIVRTYPHDVMGGENGFDFGSALVMVDNKPAFTGIWTNKLDGSTHTFRNGVRIKKSTKEGEE